jgi:single-strand DNA-binding protein
MGSTNVNRVIIAGNLTRDPEVRYLPSGTAVTEMGLAIDDSYKNKDNEMVPRTCFVDIVVWGKQGELCHKYLAKGRGALVEGRLQLDQWENQQGEKRSKLRVRADRVQFLGSPGSRAEGGPDDAPPPPAERHEPAPGADDDDDLPF